jgi:dipeptidyl aminopeptidase/acylaminoacyl peptidase
VATVADPERAGDLAVVRGGSLHWLTDVSAPLRAAGIRPVQEIEARSTGDHPVHGWLVLPDPATHGDGPHPVLLNIHGGPFSQYDCALFDEAQVYAGAGYAVLMCNPRGSSGYGFDHGRSIRHALGTLDADDVIAFLDHALSAHDDVLDAGRVGVMGGSYGGFMTALLTTRTSRFDAAIVERGYLDGGSFYGSSDIGWFFPGEYHGSQEAAVEQTPMTHVEKVQTPTLVIHSEADWRCPVEQGQRWFAALKMRGVPTELLLFPGEGHELSRSGRPRHRLQRFEHILRWWGEHLPV